MFDQIELFISYIASEKGKSENTQLSYRRDLRQLAEWLLAYGVDDVKDVTPKMLAGYVRYLEDQKKSVATVSRSIASMHAFFTYLIDDGRLSVDPTEQLKSPKVIKKAPTVISDEDLEKLMKAPSTDTVKGLRDRAMLELMAVTGLRVSELIGLRLEDVDLKKHTVAVSGSRNRTITFDKRISKYLNHYCSDARPEMVSEEYDDGSFFLNVSGEGMTRQGFWKILKKYAADAGIEVEITPAILRHTFAANAIKSGEDIKKVQSILGHSDVTTTSEYLQV